VLQRFKLQLVTPSLAKRNGMFVGWSHLHAMSAVSKVAACVCYWMRNLEGPGEVIVSKFSDDSQSSLRTS